MLEFSSKICYPSIEFLVFAHTIVYVALEDNYNVF